MAPKHAAVDLVCNVHYIDAVSDYLGEFEYLVLLAIARLGDAAYGVTIRDELIERAGRPSSFGAIHSTLRRLEAKGLLQSMRGAPEPIRGGRAKKFVRLTPRGKTALKESQATLHRMAHGLNLQRL
jgi:PadR family transcriptional regulator, regulatory protein PadR